MNKQKGWFGVVAASVMTIIVIIILVVTDGKSQFNNSMSPSKEADLSIVTENSSYYPSNDWNFSITTPSIVQNSLNIPIYRWFPDGHISVVEDGSGNWIMFWSEFESYRSVGPSPFPETQTTLLPKTKVFGQRGGSGWDNGGSWLNSVFRMSENNLIAFYHAEDHWNPPNPEGVAWKSIAVTYSTDNGMTWLSGEQIITSWKTKPPLPEWGGAGDHSVVWDAENQRWICYYQEQVENGEAQIHMAASLDPIGSPGTWYKWDGSNFTAPGLGGKGMPLAAFKGYQGGNPSVHYNAYLGIWIMVYGGWDGVTYISSSVDMLNWQLPQSLVVSEQGGRAWYPTIIGDYGDTYAGQNARLYYADIASDFSSRKFYMSEIAFVRND